MSQEVQFIPATAGQRRLAGLYHKCDLLFVVGPAGGGKTHAAVGLALADVLSGSKRKKLFLARPLVSCGEDMGFLKGDVAEKLGPWHGALSDVIGNLTFTRPEVLLSRGEIELLALGLMRGRTVSRSVAILDEAQNATLPQLRMFLSRLGEHGKLIVCGDPHQADIPGRALLRVVKALRGLPGVGVVHLPATECVRHPLVPEVLKRLQGV